MGFIIPGKPLNITKIERRRQRRTSKPYRNQQTRKPHQINKLKRDSIISLSNSSSSHTELVSRRLSINTNLNVKKLTLNHLPIDIITKIFILAGPNNNLPLINKSLYSNLKISGINNSETITTLEDLEIEDKPWTNYSILIKMIKMFFLHDINTRLNIDKIQTKIKYYEDQILQLRIKYVEVERSLFYTKLLINLSILKEKFKFYTSIEGKYVIDESLLNYKFISSQLLENLNTKTFGFNKNTTEYELIKIKSLDEIQLNRKLRNVFLKLKFKEIDILLKIVDQELSNGAFQDPSVYDDDFMKYQQFIKFKEIEFSKIETITDHKLMSNSKLQNPNLANFDDESLPDEGFTKDEFSFYNFKNGYNLGHEFFGEIESYQKQFKIPIHIFLKSISNKRYFEILQFLIYNYPHGNFNCDLIMLKILNLLKPSNIDFQIKIPFLSIVTLIMFDNVSNMNQSLIESFKLYDKYCHISNIENFGINVKGQNMLENLYEGMYYMCSYLLGHITYNDIDNEGNENQNNESTRELWILALKLKNYKLTDLLSKFSKCPDIDILNNYS
ncbi:hypothetical protein KGF54_002902 [Candida jiufengensis]|uniref:uncharacterized protein n=1 Tax=Candida jiufengensis TaxID=497108 RepID=UPI002224B1A3|nr:uncharacterized protein KGF54_002902 [Candida jiufengensis]KAI5953530.1 hypothetical protein KGF54_002902 [Candida jiufengensis]